MSTNYREQYARYGRYFRRLKQAYEVRPEIRASIELLLTFLTVCFFAIFALRPTANTISELISSINTQKEIREKMETKITNLSHAKQVWNQENKRIPIVDQALPNSAEPDGYLRQIEGLAANKGVSLHSFNVEEVHLFGKEIVENKNAKRDVQPLGLNVNAVSISFGASGSYNSLIEFLEQLENLRRVIRIDSFIFSTNSSLSDQLSLSITGRIPYHKAR